MWHIVVKLLSSSTNAKRQRLSTLTAGMKADTQLIDSKTCRDQCACTCGDFRSNGFGTNLPGSGWVLGGREPGS